MNSNTFLSTARCARCSRSSLRPPITLRLRASRSVSTLPNNPHIYIHPDPSSSTPNTTKSLLSLLPTTPPTPSLALGTTTSIPPTPSTFTENPSFLPILQSVLHTYAALDPDIKQQAAAFASPGGFNLGGGGGAQQQHSSRRRRAESGAGPTSSQGGAGGANRGGWIHVSDTRNPPDWGRIASPEDIFGSLEVDGDGRFVDGGSGNYQASGTYRMVTREGILGLPPFLRERLVERLRELEQQMQQTKG